ncbi:transposase [Streptomyces yunnanensis]|uniref:Transposase n=1 Tax=Streptomyces yunnanensis TaxID=156453 RepID=A0ABY8AKG6_9ACTN|nr:transposase [Streptomyces yunnanensis]WEB45487.1 transposase [Streptomyces yunnanensis]
MPVQGVQERPELAPEVSIGGFAEEVFKSLPRVDQRRWAAAYLRGLLVMPGRKVPQHLAVTVPDPHTATHSLRRFVNSSPWDWSAPREALACMAAEALPVQAWTIGAAVIPKRGSHSVGVHRRFDADAGRVRNCQMGVGLFLASHAWSLPVDWQIAIDRVWSGDAERRRRSRLPHGVVEQPLWAYALELIDRLAAARPADRTPVVAGACDPADVTQLAAALTRRGMDFLIQVSPGQPVVPLSGPDSGPLGAEQCLRRHGRRYPFPAVASSQPPAPRSALGSTLVRLPSGRHGVARARSVYRLWWQQGKSERATNRLWFTSLTGAGPGECLSLLRHLSATRAAVRRLSEDFGLRDFEGRSYPGWHHHMTLVSAAYAYRCLAGATRRAEPA